MHPSRVKQLNTGNIITHPKGGTYKVINRHLKVKFNGNWYSCIQYQDLLTGKVYARVPEDMMKFEMGK